jgi:hypothetical protein
MREAFVKNSRLCALLAVAKHSIIGRLGEVDGAPALCSKWALEEQMINIFLQASVT